MDKFLPLELLQKVNREFPGVLDYLIQSAKDPDWDERCLVPIGLSLALFRDYDSASLAQKEACMAKALQFSALAPWHLDKEVYEFDDAIQGLLFDQAGDDDLEIPGEVLGHLPYRAFYVRFASPLLDGGERWDGFFVHHEWDVQRGGELALRLLFLSDNLSTKGAEIKLSSKTLGDNFEIIRSLSAKNIKKLTGADGDLRLLAQSNPDEGLIKKALELVLYICAQNADVTASPKQATYRPKRSIQDRYSEVRFWDVGARLAPKIKRSRTAGATGSKAGSEHKSHASPRAHFRRGHWHHYWTGPKTGSRKLVLKWTAPMLIGAAEEDQPVVIHRVDKNN